MKFNKSFQNVLDEKLNKHYTTIPRQKFYIFLSILETQSGSFPTKELKYTRARLKTAYLQKQVGSRYVKSIINILIDEEIINRDNHYIKGEKSIDYWYNNIFLESLNLIDNVIDIVDILDDNGKQYKEAKDFAKKQNKSARETHPLLYSILNTIEFDYDKAVEWLQSLNYNNEIDKRKHLTYTRMIIDLKDKNWTIAISEKSGRIFHTFNLIKSELRSFCTINGEPLKGLDLKTSQPFIFGYFLKSINKSSNDINKYFDIVINSDIYTYCGKRYIEITGSNTYKEFNKKKGINITKTLDINNRKDLKTQFYRLLYKSNKGIASPFDLVFKTDFPDLYNTIIGIRKSSKKGDNLAIKLQLFESKIFMPVFNKLGRKYKVLPVHDSLFMPQSAFNIIEQELKTQFNRLGYINYTLKRDENEHPIKPPTVNERGNKIYSFLNTKTGNKIINETRSSFKVYDNTLSYIEINWLINKTVKKCKNWILIPNKPINNIKIGDTNKVLTEKEEMLEFLNEII